MQKNRNCWDIWHYVATPDLKPEARKRPAGQVGFLNEVDEPNVQSTSKRRRNMRYDFHNFYTSQSNFKNIKWKGGGGRWLVSIINIDHWMKSVNLWCLKITHYF